MTSHRTLKTAYPFIKHIPVSLAKVKARTAAARESARQEQQDTTEKRTYEGLWLVLSGKERETVGCQYRVAPGIGHDRKRGQ